MISDRLPQIASFRRYRSGHHFHAPLPLSSIVLAIKKKKGAPRHNDGHAGPRIKYKYVK
jgi:hypothetical protein